MPRHLVFWGRAPALAKRIVHWDGYHDPTMVLKTCGKGDTAIRENTVELDIKESLSQRGIGAEIQTGGRDDT